MTKTTTRRFILLAAILYTLLILYFQFFAFNRIEHSVDYTEYEFMLVPSGVPLTFPKLTFSWIYDFGNVAAFIPFGILIPWLLPNMSFKRFIAFFILAILIAETMQSLTFRGTFDVDDVISNTLGTTTGYIGYRIGFSAKITTKKLIAAILSMTLILAGIIAVSETINLTIQKKESSIQALSHYEKVGSNAAQTDQLPSFTVANHTVAPKLNLYSSEDGSSKEYTYRLVNKQDVKFYANYGIPDDVEFKGEVSIEADGDTFFQTSNEYSNEVVPIEMHFDQVHEIKITVTGNAKLWDVGITENKHWWE